MRGKTMHYAWDQDGWYLIECEDKCKGASEILEAMVLRQQNGKVPTAYRKKIQVSEC